MISLASQFLRAVDHGYWNARARMQFRIRGVAWPRNLQVRGRLGLSARGSIELGENVTIINSSKYNRAGVNHPSQIVSAAGARLRIGNEVGMSGSVVYCTERIEIGNNVMLGVNSKVYDTDFHPLDFRARRDKQGAESAPVVIGDDVWLCANVTVLKGVTIGARSVIAAGSVVTSSIPEDSLAGGIPARVIRRLDGPKKP